MVKKYSLLVLLSIFAFLSCNKDRNWVDATVIDSGDVTYEGCGYVLQLEDSALLKPTYLPGNYQHNGLKIKLDYHHTGIKDTCKFGSVVYDLINIDHIEKRN